MTDLDTSQKLTRMTIALERIADALEKQQQTRTATVETTVS